MDDAKKVFRPEFLNRLDDVIVFHSLDKEALMKILDLEVGKVVDRLQDKNIDLVLDKSALDFLVEKGHDPEYGARPMRRSVERFMEDPLAEEILRGKLIEGSPINVTAGKEKLVFSQKYAAEKAVVGACFIYSYNKL